MPDYSMQFDTTARNRKTVKVLREIEHDRPLFPDVAQKLRHDLQEMAELASWAPFHHFAHPSHITSPSDSHLPWRFHILEKPACMQLIAFLEKKAMETGDQEQTKWLRAWNTKIPKLLSGAGALVLVTWLPDPKEEGLEESKLIKLNERNAEHLCAASAATQNLLLAATARNYHSYWSSGGILRNPESWEELAIPTNQSLVGAIFISPEKMENAEVLEGSLREKRGTLSGWVNWH